MMLASLMLASLLAIPYGSCARAPEQMSHLNLGFSQGNAELNVADAKDSVTRFSKLLQFVTVSDRDANLHVLHPDEFQRMHRFINESYSELWKHMSLTQVGEGGLSLLITWKGSDPSLEPLLFISHLDVVPVANETLDQWTYPPFSGAVAEGYIWGRGALDVKIGVAGLLEGALVLVRKGWQPERTIYFGFGQDEEVGGDFGAGKTADYLKSIGVSSLDAVIDEGTSVFTEGFPPYTTAPVALVATAEKGYYSTKVRVAGKGGHSSIPPIDHTSAAAAVAKLLTVIDDNPPSGSLVSPVTDFVKAIAPLMDKPWLRTIFSQPEKPEYADRILNAHLLVDTPLTAALGRTTVAVTGIQSYVGDNVLPPTATINLNFRLLPGDTVAHVVSYVQERLAQAGLNATLLPTRPDADPDQALATPVTPSDGRHFKALKQAVQELWPTPDGQPITVAPFILTGGTDSKHYIDMSKGGVLRFVPTSNAISAGDQGRVHGLNERLRVEDLGRAIQIYARVIDLLASKAARSAVATAA